MNKRGYSLLKASEYLGIDPRTLRRWVARDEVSVTRLPNGRFRVSEEEVERLERLLDGRTDNS